MLTAYTGSAVKMPEGRNRVGRLALRVPCPFCLREVEALSRVQAACVLGIKERALDELLAGGRIHSIQTINHHLWVCKDSLFIE